MVFTRNIKKKILTVVLIVMAVLVTSRTHATPLYGGYNGESETWIEYNVTNINTLLFSAKVILGVDVNDHRWAKFRIAVAPFIVRFDITYDSADILSINLTTLLPWPVQFGREIDIYQEENSLWWFMVYLVSGVGGVDSEGTRWGETGIPGVYGSGSDNKDNQWAWIKILKWLFGVGEDFTIDGELFLKQNNSKDFEKELLSLQNHCSRAYARKVHIFLEKLTDNDVMKDMVHFSEKVHKRAVQLPFAQNSKGLPVLAPLDEMQSELDSLSATIAEEVFTEELKDDLHKLLNNFAHDIQPQLRKISETLTAP
jgi:hypothetical protein